MKKRFYEGEEVVCVDKEMKSLNPLIKCTDLVYNKLYAIEKYYHIDLGVWWVSVIGVDDALYSEDTFAPITQIEELMDEVNEIVFVKENILGLWKLLTKPNNEPSSERD